MGRKRCWCGSVGRYFQDGKLVCRRHVHNSKYGTETRINRVKLDENLGLAGKRLIQTKLR